MRERCVIFGSRLRVKLQVRVPYVLKQLGIQPGEQLHNLSGANVSGVI